MDLQPTSQGIHAQPASDVEADKPNQRGSVGFQYEGQILRYQDLKEVTVRGEGVMELDFCKGMQHSTLKLKCNTSAERDELLENIKKFSAKTYVCGYDPTILSTFQHAKHVFKEGTFGEKLATIPHVAVDLMLKTTLFCVDVKDMRKETRWPMCFVGAMTWLAIFSYGMLEIAEQIHCNIPAVPNAFLGITVCAVGTSFPNAVASILMAQKNKPAAAIANALGSNVQNVFLAMALPWVIYSCQNGVTSIPQNVEGINEGVAWMMGTLILVLIMTLMPPVCAMNKSYGYILTLVYIGYLVQTSGEAFGFLPILMK